MRQRSLSVAEGSIAQVAEAQENSASKQINPFISIAIQLLFLCSLFGVLSSNVFANDGYYWKISQLADNPIPSGCYQSKEETAIIIDESFDSHGYSVGFLCGDDYHEYDYVWGKDKTNNRHARCIGGGSGSILLGIVGMVYSRPISCEEGQVYNFKTCSCIKKDICPEGQEYVEGYGCQKAPEDTGDSCNTVSNPVHLGQGNKFQTETDFTATGAFPLRFARFYNSRSLEQESDIGTKWSHSYIYGIKPMVDVRTINNDFSGFHLYRSNGRNIKFSPEAGQSTDLPVVLSDEIVQDDKTLRTATYKNGMVETYEMSLDEATDTMSNGRLISIRTIQGFEQTLTYNAEGQLTQVADDQGNSLAFTYNVNGQMETMTDPGQNVYTYIYDGDLLVSVIYPDSTPGDTSDNPTKIYHYEDTNFPTALTGITNENNLRYATWEYDEEGRAFVSKHAGESGIDQTSIAFNEDGSRTVTNPLGKQTTYHFTTVNDNLRIDYVEGHPSPSCGGTNRNYTYDANGFIASKTDWNGNVTAYTRDEMGRILVKTVAAGTADAKTTAYEYHPTLKLKTKIDLHDREGVETPIIKTTDIVYYGDAAGEEYWSGLVKSRTVTDTNTGDSRTVSYTYYGQNENGARQLKTVDGPRTDVQDITSYTYDAKGNLLTTENALGHQSHIYEYDGAGRPLTIHDANQVETVLTYTARGWLKTSSRQYSTTEYIYDNVGNVTDIISLDGSTISYTYDDANRLTDITDKHGNTIHYELNAMGGITEQQIKDPQGTLTMVRTTVRDELNRIKHSIGANVEEDIETNYDANGNIDNSVDAYQRVTDNSFDALNRVTQTQDTAGGITTSRYDQFGNVNEIQDPRGLITKYNYNALGDLKELDSPDTGITIYTHDSAGNIKTQTDAKNITVTYSYDALNRLTDVTYPDSSENIHYDYDEYDNWDDVNFGRGKLTSITDSSGTTSYKYYGNGLVYEESRTIAGTTYTFGYQYNLADKLTHITYPSGMVVQYIRDDAGKITAVTAIKDSQITTLADNIQYQPFGPQTNLQYGNGYIQANSYNLNYQLQSINTNSVLNLDYTFDHMGNIDAIQNMLDSMYDQAFTLDNLYRIDTAAGEYGVVDYDLDATGNRVAITEDGAAISYSVDPNSNRITAMGDTTFGYDATGNTISKTTPEANWVYAYNQNGRLTSVTKDGTQIASYSYNALGQRVQKTTEQGTTTQLFNSSAQLLVEESATTTKEYIYLGGQVLASYTDAEEQQQAQTGPCAGTTASNSQHETAGRAYSESETTGQTCFGTFCFGGTTTTTWFAQGSNENLGTSASTSTTLYENGSNNWQSANPNNCLATGPCPAISSTNQEHTNNSRAYTSTEMVGQTCWGTFCYGGTEQTIYKAQGSDDDLGADANTQNTLYQDPTGSFYLVDPETCPLELEDPNYVGFAYFHNDHLGTPRVVTAEDGATLWKGDYNPFGKVKETLAEGVVFEQDIRFPGQVEDRETGLYYNYYRYYQADLGRYLTSDPIGLDGGINTYAYVGGNPVMFVDPNGLEYVPPDWGDYDGWQGDYNHLEFFEHSNQETDTVDIWSEFPGGDDYDFADCPDSGCSQEYMQCIEQCIGDLNPWWTAPVGAGVGAAEMVATGSVSTGAAVGGVVLMGWSGGTSIGCASVCGLDKCYY